MWLLLACTPDDPRPPNIPPADTTPTSPTTSPLVPRIDPFAPRDVEDVGLTDVSADLSALLEHGALPGACAAYRDAPDDRRARLLCGKAMFFGEGFDTLGIPAALFDTLPELFPDETGPAWSNFGLVPDPDQPGRPLGFGPGRVEGDGIETVALTCAACHFGPLPDGRYAVGAANHGYDYGRHMMALMLVPQAADPRFDPAEHHPLAIAAVQPMLDRLEREPALGVQLGLELLPLLSLGAPPTPTVEQEGDYASWLPGTMDFVIAPLPVDDGVHTVSKIIPLWDLPTDAEIEAAGMPHAMLAWSGGATSLGVFLDGFVTIGGGDAQVWDHDALGPLHDYILSLRAPTNPEPPDADAAARGEAVFDAACASCHDGPRGSGREVYTYDEIGTDAAMAAWGAPDASGAPCCGLGDADTVLTRGIKSPRIGGTWAQQRFLHNGSLPDLASLLCLTARPDDLGEPFGTAGHTYGCDHPERERRDLVAYLLAH